MINLNTKQTQLVSGGSYFTEEEYAETFNNWGLVFGAILSSLAGGLAFNAGASAVVSLSIAGIGAVLGYQGGYSMGMLMNSDPNSNVLHGAFVTTTVY